MLNVLFRRAAPPARARLCRLATLLACAWLLWAPVTNASGAETAEKSAPTPFANYQGWRDEPLQDWREVNDRVGEIGGWRTYLRESQQDGDGSDSGQGRHDHQGH
jgi:hypothetical protein